MQSNPPSARHLAAPGIRFPQNISAVPNVVVLAEFRRARDGFNKGQKLRGEAVPTDDECGQSPHRLTLGADDAHWQLIACVAAAFIMPAVVLGPLTTWLLLRAFALTF